MLISLRSQNLQIVSAFTIVVTALLVLVPGSIRTNLIHLQAREFQTQESLSDWGWIFRGDAPPSVDFHSLPMHLVSSLGCIEQTRIHVLAGEYNLASESISQCGEQTSDVLWWRGLIAFLQNRMGEAIIYWRECDCVEYFQALGAAGIAANDRKLVSEVLEIASALDRSDAGSLLALANYYYNLNDYELAASYFERALARPEGEPYQMTMARGHLSFLAKDWEKASEAFAEATKYTDLFPSVGSESVTRSYAYFWRGASELRLGDAAQASRHLKIFLDAMPSHAQAHFLLAQAYEQLGNRPLAQLHAQMALELSPGERAYIDYASSIK